MKKRFKLEEWLMDRTKTVCQKDGSHVEILKHNLDHEFCIVGVVRTKTKGEIIRQWNHDGRYSSACETEYDLVFDCEDESEILTDFEKMIGERLFSVFDPDTLPDNKKLWLKDESKKILESATKELSKREL